ncbi:MAG: hypothetical protein ACE5KA_05215 [Nitrososphaerales archaeon]
MNKKFLFATIVVVAAMMAASSLIPAMAKDEVIVCHKPGTPAEKTLSIDASALDGHLGHGDVQGACA